MAGDDLAGIDAADAGAEDFGDKRRFIGGKRETRGAECAQSQPDMREGVISEDELEDQRRTTEDHRIGARQSGEEAGAGELHAGENDARQQAACQPQDGRFNRDRNSLEQIRQAQIVKEEIH